MNRTIEPLLREREAADYLGVSDYWLQRQRWLGTGPIWCRVGGPQGRAVRYRKSDLDDWILLNLVGGESRDTAMPAGAAL